MPPPSTERLQGTLAHSILKTLALEPIYGWGIAQPILQVSQELLQVGQGSLNPALDRLEAKRGFDRNGPHRRTTAAPGSTHWPGSAASRWNQNARIASAWPVQPRWSSRGV